MFIIGFSGFISSGKDTAADYLVNFHGFRRESFANSLKDCVSLIFGWDRTLIEGRTTEARQWREQVDEWWANRLNIPHFTPRWVLQNVGTNVLREKFHNDIWIASLENKLRKTQDNIVISDVRFQNEIDAIHNMGGKVIRIKRGQDPSWYSLAASANNSDKSSELAVSSENSLKELKIHPSEYSWVEYNIDYTVENNSTVEHLFSQIKDLLLEIRN